MNQDYLSQDDGYSGSYQNKGFPPDYYNSMLYGSQYDNRVGLVKELSPRQSLLTAINELRGEIKDPGTGRIVKQVKPMMNEDGIAVFFHCVTAAANDINTMSNYRADEKLIYRIMMKWITDIVFEFYIHRKVYEIKEESHCALIVNKAVGLMLPAFFKALGAGDRRAATASVSEMIQRAFSEKQDSGSPGAAQQQTKKRGILSRLNPFG